MSKVKVELGCGENRRDIEGWKNIGIDIIQTPCTDFICCLGYDELPLEDDSVDLVSAIDVLEHIPRVEFKQKYVEMIISNLPTERLQKKAIESLKEHRESLAKQGKMLLDKEHGEPSLSSNILHRTFERVTPFIYLMNEIYRVLKHEGILYVEVTVSDYAFRRDTTHINQLSEDWWKYFSSIDNLYYNQEIIKTDFQVVDNQFKNNKDILCTKLRALKKQNMREPII